MERMILEFSRIETLEGVTRTPYNQYDSLILPLKAYLKDHGVQFEINTKVVDIDFKDGEGITATAIHVEKKGKPEEITLKDGDVCIVTNGCMTDSATLGDMNKPAPEPEEPSCLVNFGVKVAAKKAGPGNPEPFFGNVRKQTGKALQLPVRAIKLLKMIENFSGNIPGSGALMTFKDSSWLMSIVVAAQPHFRNQPRTRQSSGAMACTRQGGRLCEEADEGMYRC